MTPITPTLALFASLAAILTPYDAASALDALKLHDESPEIHARIEEAKKQKSEL